MLQLAACFSRVVEPGCPLADEATLRAYVDAAFAQRPQLAELGAEALVTHAAQRCGVIGLQPREHAADLLLALACTRGHALALASFEREHAGLITRVLQQRRAEALADDVAQSVIERLLFTRGDSPAQIAGYRGVGPLRAWVALAASTQLAMARRSAGRLREDPVDDDRAQSLIERDPELRYLQRRYQQEAEASLVAALQALGDRERVLLRLQLGERLTLEQLAAMYSVDRATVARWLAKAREQLRDGLRRELRARTGAAAETCESLLQLVQSQLDVSVLRHLR